MQRRNQWIIAIAVALLPLAGCDRPGAIAKVAPLTSNITVEPGGLKRITLKDLETKRLGIEFGEVAKTGERLTMPYNALLYDPTGREWAFTSPAPNVYIRAALKVETIEGDKVYLKEGPPLGTKLVTAGAAELYGIDFGIGK